MSLNTILSQLADLSGEELDQLAIRIKVMRSLIGSNGSSGASKQNTKHHEDDTDLNLMLKCAADTAKSLGADNSAYFQLREAARSSPAFREKMPGLMEFLKRACPQRSQQYALTKLSMRLLFKDMTEAGYPVSARTILAHIHRIPSILNKSFPGYAQAGLLHWIVQRQEV